jgi:hypothetical protein
MKLHKQTTQRGRVGGHAAVALVDRLTEKLSSALLFLAALLTALPRLLALLLLTGLGLTALVLLSRPLLAAALLLTGLLVSGLCGLGILVRIIHFSTSLR